MVGRFRRLLPLKQTRECVVETLLKWFRTQNYKSKQEKKTKQFMDKKRGLGTLSISTSLNRNTHKNNTSASHCVKTDVFFF